MINERIRIELFLALWVVICLAPIEGGAESLAVVPGELVVAFEDEESTVLTINECLTTSIYPALNQIFTRYELECARPLFRANSLMKNVFLLKFPAETNLELVAEAIEALAVMRHTCVNSRIQKEIVDYVPGDYAMTNDWNNDGRLDQWTYYMTQVDRAWDITRGDSSIVVAVLDTGIDWEHPDLMRNLWINQEEDINHNGLFDNFPDSLGGDLDTLDNDDNGFVNDVVGWDFHCQNYFDPNNPDSACPDSYNPQHRDHPGWGFPHTHGSQMASMISAVTDNPADSGMAGIAWKAKIMGVRCAEYDGLVIDIFEGTQYAIDNGADFMNMSFSIPVPDSLPQLAIFALWRELLDRALDEKGIITITSADDRDTSLVFAPDKYPNVWDEFICVAGVDSTRKKTVKYGSRTGSNYGAAVDLCAPVGGTREIRQQIIACGYQPQVDPTGSLYPGSQHPHTFPYTSIATSGACAQVVGVLALLKSVYPDASPSFLEAELKRGAMPLHPDEALADSLGAGVVNAYRSLTQWGTISQNTTWSNVVYVSGDVTVAPGKTLTIDAGTTIYIDPDDNEDTGSDTDRTEFNIEGYLDVNGTEADPVVFQSRTGESKEDWVGFYFDSLSTGGSFEHCVIKHAEYGIETYVSITIKDCVIDSCRYSGVMAIDGNLLVQDSEVTNSGTWGIYTMAPSQNTATITGTSVEDCGANGIQVRSGSVADIRNTDLIGNDKGLYIGSGASVDVNEGCIIKHNDIGIHSYNASPEIYNSVIDSNTTDGIYAHYYSGGTIEGNSIRYNGVGIYCSSSTSPTVRWNEITYNSEGVAAVWSGQPDVGTDVSHGNNQFQYNTGYHISNLTMGLTVMAESNYWGSSRSPCFPKQSKIYGSVDYDPALCSNPLPVSPFSEDEEIKEGTAQLPSTFGLGPSVPNPFNPTTTIHYQIPNPGSWVQIRVYNVAGQLVRTLVNESKQPGYFDVSWDGSDTRGQRVASSVYFVQMAADGFAETRKIVVLK